MSSRMQCLLFQHCLHHLPRTVLLGFEWLRAVPCWMHCLFLLDWLYLYCLFRWILSGFSIVHSLFAALRELLRTNHLQHLPRRLLQIRCLLFCLSALLQNLHSLHNLPHLRNWLLSERSQLSRLHHALRYLQRCNHLHHLQHQFLAFCYQHLPGLHFALRHLLFIWRLHRLQHGLLSGKRNLLRLHCLVRYLYITLSVFLMPIRILLRWYFCPNAGSSCTSCGSYCR